MRVPAWPVRGNPGHTQKRTPAGRGVLCPSLNGVSSMHSARTVVISARIRWSAIRRAAGTRVNKPCANQIDRSVPVNAVSSYRQRRVGR